MDSSAKSILSKNIINASAHRKGSSNMPKSKDITATDKAEPKVIGIHQQPVTFTSAHNTGHVNAVPRVHRIIHVSFIECSSIS